MKVCITCSVNKANSEYWKSSPNVCKSCKNTQNVQWKQANKERQKENLRRASLRRVYGITEEQYEELLTKQGHSCAVCNRLASEFSKRLAVDHNHVTGEIRGLLCTYCNHRMVGRHRDGAMLRKIADYIEQGTGWFVPPKKRRKRGRPKAKA